MRRTSRAPLALSGLLLIGGAMVAVLLLLANRYGFHRDELYFIVAGRHPDWGYVDQPPFTPLVSAAAVAIGGLSPLSVRVLPALTAGLVAVLAGAIAREFGGGRRAQLLAAGMVALSAVLGLGHLDSTTTYDVLAWVVVSWLVIRQLGGTAPPAEWLWVGLAAGIGLQNKSLVVLLGIGLAVGLVLSRRWELLRSGWSWAGIGLAVLIWLPNVVWQAANGFPQLEMSGRIAARVSLGDALLVIPFQLILAGPFLFPVMLAGLWWLLRRPAGGPWRAIGWAYLVVILLTILLRGQIYYAAGLMVVVMAAGAIPLDGWLSRGHARLRGGVLGAAAVLSGTAMVLLTLPVLPPEVLAETPIGEINSTMVEQIGWDDLVDTVQGAVDVLEPDQRARAAILTANYGEAAALQLLGGSGMPPAYSGHNSFASWGPPPDDRNVVLLVGWWDAAHAGAVGACSQRAVIGNAAGVDNEERGAQVWVCLHPDRTWSEAWPLLGHLD